MFEKNAHSQSAFAPGIFAWVKDNSSGSDELRRFDWNELSARINAARDLRQEMRRQQAAMPAAIAHSGSSDSKPYPSVKHRQRSVNRDALEGRKACSAIELSYEGETARGEKENTND